MNSVVLNDLYDYNLKIFQKTNLFKFSLDSILLAEFVSLNSKISNILDLCSGNASVPMILSTKTKAKIFGIEIQSEIFELGVKSIEYNNLSTQIFLYNDNILNVRTIFKNKKFDIITCNPPFFKVHNQKFLNECQQLAIARHEILINLEDIFSVSSSLLDDGRHFYLVHRSDRIDEIFVLAEKYKIPVKTIKFITTNDKEISQIVLIHCIKGAKQGVKVLRELDISCLKSFKNIF